jgi:hypothetical protein
MYLQMSRFTCEGAPIEHKVLIAHICKLCFVCIIPQFAVCSGLTRTLQTWHIQRKNGAPNLLEIPVKHLHPSAYQYSTWTSGSNEIWGARTQHGSVMSWRKRESVGIAPSTPSCPILQIWSPIVLSDAMWHLFQVVSFISVSNTRRLKMPRTARTCTLDDTKLLVFLHWRTLVGNLA